MIPTSLADGRYVLERRLGAGGMAVVVLGRDTALDRPVAVKLLSERAGGDPQLRERFLRESRLAAQLAHRNVVAVYDCGEEVGQPYIVLELVEGLSLAEEAERRGTLPAAEVEALGHQACAGLEHAHARGVVHRDVKPQNLLLAGDGTLKVADFGIARAGGSSTGLTEAGTVLGTAAYMAPEVVHGEPATAAADVYGLGAVLYELLTGRPPRQAATIAELALDVPPRPPSDHVSGIPPTFEDAIMRCLAHEAGHRPSAAELAVELGGPTLSHRTTRVQRRLERTRLDRRLWLAPAAIGILVVVLAAITLGGGDPAPTRIEPVPAGAAPTEDARNLAAWLRENAEEPG